MRSDKEIRRIAQEDITGLTSAEHKHFDENLSPSGSGFNKYKPSMRDDFKPQRIGKAHGGKIHRGRKAIYNG
jgi:hypothetical protein